MEWELLIETRLISPWLENRDLYNAACCSTSSLQLTRQIRRARVRPYNMHHVMDTLIEVLEVDGGQWQICNVLQRTPHLRSLLLDNNSLVGSNAAEMAATINTALPKLEELRLSRVFPGFVLRDCMRRIRTLAINRCIVIRSPPNDNYFSWGLAEAKNLTALDLSHNSLRPSQFVKLIGHVQGRQLRELDVSHNGIGSRRGAIALAETMRRLPHLEVLRMRCTLLAEAIDHIAAALVHTPKLCVLDVAKNWIHDADKLTEGLKSLPGLTYLDVSQNDFGPHGTNTILSATTHVKTVKIDGVC